MDSLPKIAVIIPCYNEAQRLAPDKFLKAVADNSHLYFFFVNDGSSDRTQKILSALRACSPHRISLLNLESNQGKSEAVRQGFLSAMINQYKYLGYWDADLATPLEALTEFVRILEVNPMVLMIMGSRVKLLGREIQRRKMRHYLGRIFATITALILRCDVYDTQCGAKLFRNTETVQEVFSRPFISKWVFDVEILARLFQLIETPSGKIGKYVLEYPLEQWKDIKGSKLKVSNFITGGIDIVKIALKFYLTFDSCRHVFAFGLM